MRHIRLIAGAIIMIALFGAPCAAFAHPNHDSTSVEATVSAGGQESAESDAIHKQQVIPETAASTDCPVKKHCLGGCCSGTAGNACCGFNLPVGLKADLPGDAGMVVAFIDLPFRDGLVPEALRKPPRSFS